ncbi:sulfatase-like hydrolase/transferase [Edwardsiella anguillarum]|uniref:sulfatase-like hydrolase/transferase n=1 Tax=Edwardsiella anguillarum TaxID=1821960 RepID=UPI0024B84968|nr:sulfatase-like hydrolase/transferase [Edwardsiella anguillarum]WHP81606.1 sulfatase-like hydrolase/transferase [Edwardsiella anguillarum]WHQ19108.1 sulfatase-like hydrolase/transferase [Edwardsiella anguillarum]WHQ22653.1 sulfatase-like hydrolase/transferase [Edwardsiella anguillarum]WHQ26176.1 sulfatase-like hydrolase/transferase [Edwardsiella anguillarum]WHQ29691.1 sulfatase-like hydrolase/transferase [Edwardsiella anguillarum]
MTQSNVLLITVDHWAASMMGCAGNSAIMTPTLDQLARGGIRFKNCFSTCPVCIPARRSLMTGSFPRTHGDRVFTDELPMPPMKTLAGSFGEAGYQTYAVGKLHVYPQRDRIGFDDVILSEEARYNYGVTDDYQIWLGDNGYLGKEYTHGMSNNQYFTRPWHLPEEAHQTNWTTAQMVRMIKRKDPTRPAFFYASYVHPHPPLVPLQAYWDMYADVTFPESAQGDWDNDDVDVLRRLRLQATPYKTMDIQRAKRAFYALCTHIDHQIRLLIGTLREEGLLDNTIMVFTSDHGDTFFDHGLVAKRNFYRNSTNIPLILSGKQISHFAGTIDNRVACLEDIMPTLLSACNISPPATVEGINLLSEAKRDFLYGEVNQGALATRMVTDGKYKLIYYPNGNYIQLFDIENDIDEINNLAKIYEFRTIIDQFTTFLISNLYGGDEKWVQDGKLVGLPSESFDEPSIDFGLYNQRGGHWPVPKVGAARFI